MNNIKVAVQIDEPKLLDKNADSTIALIEEALFRRYKVFIYTVDQLSLKDNNPVAICREVLKLDIKQERFLELSREKEKTLSIFDIILVRQDPPFNMKYLTATYLLEKISKNTIVLNDPLSIRNSPEKLLVTNFYKLMPPTLITKSKNEILDFLKINKTCVIKPLYGNGGQDIFF